MLSMGLNLPPKHLLRNRINAALTLTLRYWRLPTVTTVNEKLLMDYIHDMEYIMHYKLD